MEAELIAGNELWTTEPGSRLQAVRASLMNNGCVGDRSLQFA